MLPIYKCSNGRRLVVSDRANVFTDIAGAEILPCVVLISAWTNDELSISASNLFVERLIEKGCKYFVCVGTYSEDLHDLLDDIILSEIREDSFATTFHDDESLDDVVNFFVHATNVYDENRGGIVAILDLSIHEDKLIKDLLIKA